VKTYLLVNLNGNCLLCELDEVSGLHAKTAEIADVRRALMYGTACLNTGKGEREIMKHIAAIMPQEGA
jgi:hypothetical protein